MDGFRFDLMGLMDVELLNNIQKALDERFGEGQKLIYGEHWWAEPPAVEPDVAMCTKDNLGLLHPRIGAFCDATRDAVKGNLMNIYDRGFVNGGGISAGKLFHCVAGWAAGDRAYCHAPSQTINYLSCHDDWTLWDKLVCTLDPERRFEQLQPEVLRANRMAAAINFCCQGRMFFLSGEEFGRTKGGVKNSYNASPEINRLDWNRAWANRGLVDYYRGLIDLRMQLPALQDKSFHAAERFVSAVDLAPDCVGISGGNLGGHSKWDKLLLICNGGSEDREVHLPHGTWQVLADDNSSFRWQVPGSHRDFIKVPHVSALILGRIEP
jgi:pullulanase